MSRTGPEPGEQLHASVPRAGRAPGSVLIAVAAWLLTLTGGGALFVSFAAQYAYILAVRRQGVASAIEALLLDLLMIVFTLLALGLARAGQSSRAERALILACAAASAYMNVSAADVASPRSVAAYAVAPVALAVVVDRVVAVIHRHVLAGAEPSAWATVGRAAATAARITGLVLLYALRFALAAPETARGLRRMVLAAAPLPALPKPPASETVEPPRTKKAVLLALYRAAGLLAPPYPRHLGTVHPGRRMASHLRRDTPRPGPGTGVLRPLATRHHAPHHRHHPHMHPAMRDAPQPGRLGRSSRIPLTPAPRTIHTRRRSGDQRGSRTARKWICKDAGMGYRPEAGRRVLAVEHPSCVAVM